MPSIRAFCEDCDRYVRGSKEPMNHVLHLLVSLFTCGVWLPVWLLLALAGGATSYRCPRCGNVVHAD